MVFNLRTKMKTQCRVRKSSIFILMVLYGGFFIVTSVVLLCCLFKLRNVNIVTTMGGEWETVTAQGQFHGLEHGRRSRFYLSVDQWRLEMVDPANTSQLEMIQRILNEQSLSNSSMRQPLKGAAKINRKSGYIIYGSEKYPSDLNCSSLSKMEYVSFIAAGWTKAVYRARFGPKNVAVKVVNILGHDMQECLKRINMLPEDCYKKSAAKFLKEIVLLRELKHNNVVKLYGYCVPQHATFSSTPKEDDLSWNGVVIITELGNTLDTIRLLQMSWEDRLRIALGIAHILYKLAHSSLGSLVMNDFRRQQFVLVNGELRLTDVDDIGLNEPPCVTDTDCTVTYKENNISVSVTCMHSQCIGYNEKKNILYAGQQFVLNFLPHGAPDTLKNSVQELMEAYQRVSWNADQILRATEKLVEDFVTGQYLGKERSTENFKKLEDSDFPGEFDYWCHLSLSAGSCVLSVFSEEEAQIFCSQDPDCRAVVLGPEKTWTGRTLAYFKNGLSNPKPNAGHTLFMRVA